MSEGISSEVWICFINDDGQEVKGFFTLLEQTENYVKVLSGKNILILPYHRINKIKIKGEK